MVNKIRLKKCFERKCLSDEIVGEDLVDGNETLAEATENMATIEKSINENETINSNSNKRKSSIKMKNKINIDTTKTVDEGNKNIQGSRTMRARHLPGFYAE